MRRIIVKRREPTTVVAVETAPSSLLIGNPDAKKAVKEAATGAVTPPPNSAARMLAEMARIGISANEASRSFSDALTRINRISESRFEASAISEDLLSYGGSRSASFSSSGPSSLMFHSVEIQRSVYNRSTIVELRFLFEESRHNIGIEIPDDALYGMEERELASYIGERFREQLNDLVSVTLGNAVMSAIGRAFRVSPSRGV